MQNLLIRWNIDGFSGFNDTRHIGWRHFFVFNGNHPTRVKTGDVAARNTCINLSNLAVGHQFGLFECPLNRINRCFDIDHHAFTHAL